jgi:hypothetical protein
MNRIPDSKKRSEVQNQGLLSSLIQIPSQTVASLVESCRTLLLVSFQELFQNQCLIVLFVSSSID